MKNGFIGALGVFALMGCATTPGEPPVDERAKAILDGLERTGESRACLQVSQVEQIKPVTESTFLVRTGVNQWYVTEMKGRCSNAIRRQTRLQYTLPTAQLCNNEIVKTVDNLTGATLGACSFGNFERLTEKTDPVE